MCETKSRDQAPPIEKICDLWFQHNVSQILLLATPVKSVM